VYQELWGYKVEENLHLGVREQERSNTTDPENPAALTPYVSIKPSVSEAIP
jgi:hypothetical protein